MSLGNSLIFFMLLACGAAHASAPSHARDYEDERYDRDAPFGKQFVEPDRDTLPNDERHSLQFDIALFYTEVNEGRQPGILRFGGGVDLPFRKIPIMIRLTNTRVAKRLADWLRSNLGPHPGDTPREKALGQALTQLTEPVEDLFKSEDLKSWSIILFATASYANDFRRDAERKEKPTHVDVDAITDLLNRELVANGGFTDDEVGKRIVAALEFLVPDVPARIATDHAMRVTRVLETRKAMNQLAEKYDLISDKICRLYAPGFAKAKNPEITAEIAAHLKKLTQTSPTRDTDYSLLDCLLIVLDGADDKRFHAPLLRIIQDSAYPEPTRATAILLLGQMKSQTPPSEFTNLEWKPDTPYKELIENFEKITGEEPPTSLLLSALRASKDMLTVGVAANALYFRTERGRLPFPSESDRKVMIPFKYELQEIIETRMSDFLPGLPPETADPNLIKQIAFYRKHLSAKGSRTQLLTALYTLGLTGGTHDIWDLLRLATEGQDLAVAAALLEAIGAIYERGNRWNSSVANNSHQYAWVPKLEAKLFTDVEAKLLKTYDYDGWARVSQARKRAVGGGKEACSDTLPSLLAAEQMLGERTSAAKSAYDDILKADENNPAPSETEEPDAKLRDLVNSYNPKKSDSVQNLKSAAHLETYGIDLILSEDSADYFYNLSTDYNAYGPKAGMILKSPTIGTTPNPIYTLFGADGLYQDQFIKRLFAFLDKMNADLVPAISGKDASLRKLAYLRKWGILDALHEEALDACEKFQEWRHSHKELHIKPPGP